MAKSNTALTTGKLNDGVHVMANAVVQERTCSTCGVTKSLSEYHTKTGRPQNKSARCKVCQRLANKSVYCKRIDYYRAKHIAYNATDAFKDSQRKFRNTEKCRVGQKKHRQLDIARGKYPARRAIKKAVETGQMPRAATLKCQHCQDNARQYHHHKGYEPQFHLDVIPLCIPCHKIADKAQRGQS